MQTEMKLFGGSDTMILKQHFGKKIMELEDEKRTVQVLLECFSAYHILHVLSSFKNLSRPLHLNVTTAREGPPIG